MRSVSGNKSKTGIIYHIFEYNITKFFWIDKIFYQKK